MKIGIDISQMAYEGTGVARYVESLVAHLLATDNKNEYVLFFASLRKRVQNSKFKIQNYNSKFKIVSLPIPPTVLDLLWNRLHVGAIENFIGDVDVFISSDWTQPPTRNAKKVTILYDLIVYKFPEETDAKIVETQKRKLEWVKKESDMILCISESTKKDAMEILGIEEERLKVIGAGV